MGEIQEVFDDIRDTVGDKWFYILMGAGVLFGLYNLIKGSGSSGDNLVPVTTVSSYPDVVTNANVVIDSIQNSIDYSEEKIIEEILKNSEATNNYINSGFESQEKLFDEYFDEFHGSLDMVTDKQTADIISSMAHSTGSYTTGSSSANTTHNAIKDMTTELNGVTTQKTEKPATETMPSLSNQTNTVVTKPSTTTTTPTTTKPTTPIKDNVYTYTTKAGLNTSTSIVDALKATGADSSFANRTKIAAANGISNYTGSASQNVALLNKLKSGTLKKV